MKKDTETIANIGNKGPGIKSDCHVSIQLTKQGGLDLNLMSKVDVMFGKANRQLVSNMFEYYQIQHAKIQITDSGALPFVIMARIEAAIKKLTDTDREYLPEMIPQNQYQTQKDSFRFSRLYLPGNSPKLMINAGIHHPNGIILDFEDAVAPNKKYEARFLVRNALLQCDFYGAERMVRINQIPAGLDDLDYIVPHNVNLILIPKCESANQVEKVNQRIDIIKKEKNIKGNIWLMPIIESALGVVKAYEIASAADNIVSIAIGLEDYTADLGTRRTNEGRESFFARSMVVNAARAAGVQPIDSVFSDVSDMEALKQNVITSKGLGFDGMGCIHPRQIEVIHKNFAPNNAEIERAKKIVNAFYNAQDKGLGVVSLGSKMIDAPVVKRAQKSISLAISLGLLAKNWRENFEG